METVEGVCGVARGNEPKVSYRSSFRRCGKPNCSTCGEGPGHGPYWYAQWREGNRVRSRYIGLQAPLVETEPAEFRVSTLGRLSIRLTDGSEFLPTGRVRSLLTLLLASSYGSVGREEIAESIWPEYDSLSGDQNLRVTIAALRRQLGSPEFIRVNGPTVILLLPTGCRDDFQFEVTARDALATDDPTKLTEAVERYTGIFLPDDIYDDWTRYRRQVLLDLFREVTLRAVLRPVGSQTKRMSWLRRLIRDNRYDEQAVEQLALLLAAASRRIEALKLLDEFEALVRRELEADISASLSQLRQSLASP